MHSPLRAKDMEQIWQNQDVINQTATLARSYQHFTGRELLPDVADGRELARRVCEAPFVLVSHGIESDPILNYGNALALRLWEMSWEELTRTPSRLTAEATLREERARLLAAADNYGWFPPHKVLAPGDRK